MEGDIVEESKRFGKQAKDVPEAIRSLTEAARHTRRNQLLLAISLAIDILLSLIVVRLAFNTRDVAREASSARTTAYHNCLSSNDARGVTNSKFQKLNGLFDQAIEEGKRKRPNEAISPEIQKAYDEFKKPVPLADCEKINPAKTHRRGTNGPK